MQADKNTKKIQCVCLPPLSLPVPFSLLSLLPHHLRELNDSAARLESGLFDLDSKPAFLNKYSVAEERWCVPPLPQITAYVEGGCLCFGPMATEGELIGGNVAFITVVTPALT